MAIAMTVEQDKPVAQSRLEIIRDCEIIKSEAAPHGPTRTHALSRGART
jgi:hypothetical protein